MKADSKRHQLSPPHSDRRVDSGYPFRAAIAIVVAVLMIILAAGLFLILSKDETPQQIVIATGAQGGTYHTLGLAMAAVLEAEGIAKSVEVLSTASAMHSSRIDDGIDFSGVL